MEIKTKFNLGDTVYYIEDNKIHQGKVVRIDTNIKVFAQTLREYNKNVILLSLSHPDILTYAEDIREGYYWANLFADILEDRKDF